MWICMDWLVTRLLGNDHIISPFFIFQMGFKDFLCSPRKLGKIPIFTHIFQMGWNHQLDGFPTRWLPFLQQDRWLPFKYSNFLGGGGRLTSHEMWICMDVSENSGVFPPNHPLENRVFHQKNHPFSGSMDWLVTRLLGNDHIRYPPLWKAWFESMIFQTSRLVGYICEFSENSGVLLPPKSSIWP